MGACCVHFFLLLTLYTRSASNVTCFNDTKTVYYTNTTVPADLPPVTTLIGGWQSATASMYITKILLEEKMGVEVLLWPTASEEYSGSNEWYELYDNNYPYTQYEWLYNRNIDYIIENWLMFVAQMYFHSSWGIKEIGLLGTISHVHLFVPGYTIKEHKKLTWYKFLQEQEAIDIFLNDSIAIFNKYKGEILFSRFYKWSKGGNDRFEIVYADSSTVQTRPFIFGFNPQYNMSMNLWDRIHMLGLNNTWDIWFVETEWQLNVLMDEMFAANMSFIAHLYSPSYALGAFNLEKINLPYPYPEGHCDNGMCEEKFNLIFKTVNIRAMAEFPEILTFLSRVRLSTIDVNYILAASNENEGTTVWDSVCHWLHENPAVWTNWLVDIERELPIRLDLNLNVMIALWFPTTLICALTFLALIYLLQNKEKPLIKAVSPAFLTLAAVSGILVAFAGVLWTLDEYEYGLPICTIRWIFACTGNTVLFASLLLKTWRVWYVLKNRQAVTNCKLYQGIILVYIPVAGLLIWRTIEVNEKGLSRETAEIGVQYQWQCPETQAGIYLIIYQFIISFVALFFCLNARDVPDDFNENIHIMYLCIFTMLLMGFGVIVFQSAGDTPDIRAIIVCLSHLIAGVLIEITVLGRTMYLLVSGKAGRHARLQVRIDREGSNDF